MDDNMGPACTRALYDIRIYCRSFVMGVVFGAIVVNSLSFSQKQDLYYYLTNFLDKCLRDILQVRMTYGKKVFYKI